MFERVPKTIFAALLLVLAPATRAQTTNAGAQNPITTDKSVDLMRQMSASFESLVKRVSPAVVEVQVTGFGSTDEDDDDNDNDSKSSITVAALASAAASAALWGSSSGFGSVIIYSSTGMVQKGVRPPLPERPEGCFAQRGSDPFLNHAPPGLSHSQKATLLSP